jgi:hypothetical protein
MCCALYVTVSQWIVFGRIRSHFKLVISPKKYSDPFMMSEKLYLEYREYVLCVKNVVYMLC